MTHNALFNRIPPHLTVKEVIDNMDKKNSMSDERGKHGGQTLSVKTAKRRDALAAQVKKGLAIPTPPNAAAGMRQGVEFGGFLTVPCTEILPYDRNPRLSANPKYEEIKAAIRKRHGLQDSTLSITRRPGSDRYMLYMGGNTRLQILQELYSETSDPAYLMVKCVFVEWRSEADTLSAHLVENEARADTTFFEKARGVAMLKSEIESERGTRLSLSQLSEETRKLGMLRGASTLIEYLFAVEHLEKGAHWLTKDATNRVRTTSQSLAQIADALNVDSQTFDSCMSSAFKQIDDQSDTSDGESRTQTLSTAERVEDLRDRMIASLAQHLGASDVALKRLVNDAQGKASPERIRAALDAARKNGDDPKGDSAKARVPTIETTTGLDAKSPPKPDETTQSPSTDAPIAGADLVENEPTDSAHDDDPAVLFEAQLSRFCQHFALHELLRLSDSMPYGFWIEWPETNTPFDALDTDDVPGKERALAYLVLVSLSGQLDTQTAPLLPADSRWYERFTAGSFDHPDGPFDLQYQHVFLGLVGDNGGTFGMGWQSLHALMSNPSLWGWIEMLVASWQSLIAHLDAQQG